MSKGGWKKGKKPKSYYKKCANQNSNEKAGWRMDVDMRGFLVTCNGSDRERQAVREMYNLLNEYGDKLYGPEEKIHGTEKETETQQSEDEEEEDVETAMKKEVEAMKEVTKTERRFQRVKSTARNSLFIKTTVENPCSLAHNILSDLYETGVQKSRFAIRMLPFENVCKARISQIKECAKEMFKKYFETPFGTGLTYTIIFNKRNTVEINKNMVAPELGQIIKELNPLHRPNYTSPDYFVLVEVIGNLCGISVVKDYFKFKKYNLTEVCKAKQSQLENLKTAAVGDSDDHKCEEKTGNEEDAINVCKTLEKTLEEENVIITNSEDYNNEDEKGDEENSIDINSEDCKGEKTGEENAKNINLENFKDGEAEQTTKQEYTNLSRKRKAPSLSRETTEILDDYESIPRSKTVVMESLDRGETVVMESLPKSETVVMENMGTVVMETLPISNSVVMENMERKESMMDALSKGESAMDMSMNNQNDNLDLT